MSYIRTNPHSPQTLWQHGQPGRGFGQTTTPVTPAPPPPTPAPTYQPVNTAGRTVTKSAVPTGEGGITLSRNVTRICPLGYYPYQGYCIPIGTGWAPEGMSGVSAYENVGDWTWEFFGPNAYAWEAPADSAPQPAPMLPDPAWGGHGLSGDCGCGGSCGGCGGHKHGVGQATGVLGTNCFASADISTWSWCEWGSIAVGIYLLGSLIGDAQRGAAKGRKIYRAAK